jgi:hypothetical protein
MRYEKERKKIRKALFAYFSKVVFIKQENKIIIIQSDNSKAL